MEQKDADIIRNALAQLQAQLNKLEAQVKKLEDKGTS